jgi:cell wall-associated NlpC family hydrolase
MAALAARVALVVGFDVLLQWVFRLLVSLVVLGLIVTLIVVQTVAGVLTGGRPGEGTAPGAPVVAGTPIAVPVPSAWQPLPGDLGGRIVQIAQLWLGVPYVFGGCSRAGVDCSCLVQNVYAAVGIRLPRIAVDQFNATVPINDPQPGDLVFFANTYMPGVSHVGIYIGNGLQINAPTTGQAVSVASAVTGYWGAHFAGARRVRS